MLHGPGTEADGFGGVVLQGGWVGGWAARDDLASQRVSVTLGVLAAPLLAVQQHVGTPVMGGHNVDARRRVELRRLFLPQRGQIGVALQDHQHQRRGIADEGMHGVLEVSAFREVGGPVALQKTRFCIEPRHAAPQAKVDGQNAGSTVSH